MRYGLLTLLVIFLSWLLWATFSTGGLYQLKQINPEYTHPHKSVLYLISNLKFDDPDDVYDYTHLISCSVYMPNWTKAENCMRATLTCEKENSTAKDRTEGHRDISSDEFNTCVKNNRPFMGAFEWLRYSRSMYRFRVLQGCIWIMGGSGLNENDNQEWYIRNRGWVYSLWAWVRKGD
jgi:hypothetical protein